jgi:hypothetical protein
MPRHRQRRHRTRAANEPIADVNLGSTAGAQPLSLLTYANCDACSGRYTMMSIETSVPRTLMDICEEQKALKAIDLALADFDDLRAKISSYMNGYAVKNVLLPKGALVHRGLRPHALPLHASEVQHPPESLVQRFGRANQPKKPVFYGTTDWKTIFWELRAKPGDLFITSTWVTRRQLRLMLVGYTPSNLDRLGTVRRMDVSARTPSLSEEANALIHEFLASQFTDTIRETESHRYKLSAAIASVFLEEPGTGKKAPLVDGLMYPTVARNGRADNIAFLPEIVLKDLALDSVELVGVDEVKYPDEYRLSKMDKSSSGTPDGAIRWNHYAAIAAAPREDFKLSMVAPGNWVLRNKKGEVVETLISQADSQEVGENSGGNEIR